MLSIAFEIDLNTSLREKLILVESEKEIEQLFIQAYFLVVDPSIIFEKLLFKIIRLE